MVDVHAKISIYQSNFDLYKSTLTLNTQQCSNFWGLMVADEYEKIEWKFISTAFKTPNFKNLLRRG